MTDTTAPGRPSGTAPQGRGSSSIEHLVGATATATATARRQERTA